MIITCTVSISVAQNVGAEIVMIDIIQDSFIIGYDLEDLAAYAFVA